MFRIFAKGLAEILEIAAVFKDSITDLEVKKGTLNEVFIAITGKEIRQ